MASILQSPALLGGIGAAVLLLGALVLLMLRRLRGTGAGEPEREPAAVPEQARSTPALMAGAATAGQAADGQTAPSEAHPPPSGGEEAQPAETGFGAPAGQTAPAPAPAETDAGEAQAAREKASPSQVTASAASQEPAQGQNPDEVSNDDTIAEADVYLAYGLYTQARELLETALEQHPERLDYHFKLAETHFSAHDADAFTRVATAMHERLGDRPGALWERVVTMGQELVPENPLFGGAGGPQSTAASPETSAPEAPAGATTAAEPGLREDLDETLLQSRPQAEDEAAAPPPGRRDEELSPGLPALEDFDLDLPEDLSTAGESAPGAGTQAPGDMDEAPTRLLDLEADRGDTVAGSSLPTLELEPTPGKGKEGEAGGASRNELPELDLDLDLDSAGLGFELDGEESPADEDREGAVREASSTEPSTRYLEDFFSEHEAGSAGDEESLEGDDFVLGDEISTKLDLARAYIDMGDAEGARTTLEEVIAEGNEAQQQEARELMQQIP
ncbi:FimV/HubP family polar landmark protein [Ectothiorhodospira mobilis]|uniref:FimV/HubP family polar landmark protein n=1 Tax=Ectothiorhodospira mobilis TaxID=195064 RepID=UPI00190754B7